MEQWREQLTITPAFIERNETFVAVVDQQLVAFHAILQTPEALRLEHLWVLPERIGQGIGRTLFRHAAERAAVRGASSLTIESDPHAEPFYRRMGAVRIGATRSEIDGRRRELPLLVVDLVRSARTDPGCIPPTPVLRRSSLTTAINKKRRRPKSRRHV
jgi:predicted N-acetyltransferase YhbS